MKEKEKLFMNIAKLIGEQSTCSRVEVGAVIVKENRIISMGYNGSLPGRPHCNQLSNKQRGMTHHEYAERYELHAEQNAIAFAARNGIETEGATMYVTVSPCWRCAKLIIAAGIKTVLYNERYDREDSVGFMQDNGISTRKIGF